MPTDNYGQPAPDSEHPHVQLGRRTGRKSRYPKAREWGKDGELIRDIEFTDHGGRKNHPDPHQHKYTPNPTGGRKQKGKPEPVPEFAHRYKNQGGEIDENE